ncbi:hypothetical protein DVA76_19760 [Acinetobacter baumannii]|nr:hypothetical protein DVA76_19760 [Acinetobacter baumannii]
MTDMNMFLPPEAGWWRNPRPCWSLLAEIQLITETSGENMVSVKVHDKSTLTQINGNTSKL